MILDNLDRMILIELNNNSRDSFSAIGKRLCVNKNTIQFRVNRMIRNNIIVKFHTLIDPFTIGYESYRLYLKFQSVSRSIKKKMISWIIGNSNPWLLADVEGLWDLDIILWVKDNREFYSFYEKLLYHFKKYIYRESIAILNKLYDFGYGYLGVGYIREGNKLPKATLIDGNHVLDIDDKDVKILSILSDNAREEIIEIARRVNIDAKTAIRRIRVLKDMGIIKKFTYVLNFHKIGFLYFKADIRLNDYKRKKDIISYSKTIPYIRYITETISEYDLEIEFHVMSYDHFVEIMEDIIERFSSAIKNYDFYTISKEHVLRFFPA